MFAKDPSIHVRLSHCFHHCSLLWMCGISLCPCPSLPSVVPPPLPLQLSSSQIFKHTGNWLTEPNQNGFLCVSLSPPPCRWGDTALTSRLLCGWTRSLSSSESRSTQLGGYLRISNSFSPTVINSTRLVRRTAPSWLTNNAAFQMHRIYVWLYYDQ